ncbi:MAG: peptigoglycan-binding protein LysM, partial [Gammaproteobacteria bacterium]
MYRKFATGFIAASTLVSGIAQALGLGEATVQSALNQPLKAEIELVNVRDLQPNEIIANLAPREEFLRVGVDRVFFLSDLRFKVIYKDNGKAVVQVTSSKPVREPYLNFLVEVNWPNGRLLREYALLIDPPTYSLEVPQPVTPAATPTPAPSPAPVARAPAPRAQVPARQPTPTGAEGTSYGPTRASDTLWDIAMR